MQDGAGIGVGAKVEQMHGGGTSTFRTTARHRRRYRRRIVGIGEGDYTLDRGAGVIQSFAIVGLDRKRRRVLAAIMDEADMAGVEVGGIERWDRHPVDAVAGGLEAAVADVGD